MNTAKTKKYGTGMIIAMCVGMFVPSYAQYQLSPFAASIMSEMNITPSQFSTLFTAPMLPAVLLSFLAGILVDRFNPKLVLAISIGISMMGTILAVVANTYIMLFLAFVMIGVGCAVLNCNLAKLISGWYPPDQVTGKMGIVMGASTIAMAIALATTSLFPNRTVAFTVSAVGCVIALVLWLLLYKVPETPTLTADAPQMPSIKDGLKVVVRNKNIYIISFCLFFIMGANVVVGSFAPTALQERGINAVAAGTYSSVYTLGSFASCFIAPIIAKKMKSVKAAVILQTVLAFAGVGFSVPYVPEGILLGAAMFLAGFFLGGCIPLLCSLPVQLKNIGPAYAGTAGGFVATIQLMGAVTLPSYVLVPMSGGNYTTLFLIGGGCMLVSAALAMLLPKTEN